MKFILFTVAVCAVFLQANAEIKRYIEGKNILNSQCSVTDAGSFTQGTGSFESIVIRGVKTRLAVLNQFLASTTPINVNESNSASAYLEELKEARFKVDVEATEASILRNLEFFEDQLETITEIHFNKLTYITSEIHKKQKHDEKCGNQPMDHATYLLFEEFYNALNHVFQTTHKDLAKNAPAQHAFKNVLDIFTTEHYLVSWDVLNEFQFARYNLYDELDIINKDFDLLFESIEEAIETLQQKGTPNHSVIELITGNKFEYQSNSTSTDLVQHLDALVKHGHFIHTASKNGPKKTKSLEQHSAHHKNHNKHNKK